MYLKNDILTNTVELLQVECIDSERKRYQVPRISGWIDWAVHQPVDVGPEVDEHCHHIGEKVRSHRHAVVPALKERVIEKDVGSHQAAVHPFNLTKDQCS